MLNAYSMVYFYQGLFRITHTKENFHLVHVGCTWSAATHKDPLSYKCLEDNNLKRYFDYILYHELQATTKLYKELNQAKKRYETNTEIRCTKQLRTDYQIKLDEWHAFYDLRGVKYYYNFHSGESMRRPHERFIDLDDQYNDGVTMTPEVAEIVRQISVSKDERKLKNFSLGMAEKT